MESLETCLNNCYQWPWACPRTGNQSPVAAEQIRCPRAPWWQYEVIARRKQFEGADATENWKSMGV